MYHSPHFIKNIHTAYPAHIELNLFLPCRSKRRDAYRLSAWIGYRGWGGGRNGLKMAHGGMNATRVEVRALQLDLAREEEQLREATRLTDKRKVRGGASCMEAGGCQRAWANSV